MRTGQKEMEDKAGQGRRRRIRRGGDKKAQSRRGGMSGTRRQNRGGNRGEEGEDTRTGERRTGALSEEDSFEQKTVH